jgi:hypothetical protein
VNTDGGRRERRVKKGNNGSSKMRIKESNRRLSENI